MISDLAAGLALVVAGATALGVAFRRLRASFRAVEDLAALLAITKDVREVVERELNHNHGGSLKDDVHGIAIGLQRAHNRVDNLDERFELIQDDVETIKHLLAAHLKESA